MNPDVVIVNEIFPEKNFKSILEFFSSLPEMFFIFPSAYRNFCFECRIDAMKNASFVLRPIDLSEFAKAIYNIAEERKDGF